MTTKQIQQVKENVIKAFDNFPSYSDSEKKAFLTGADQFRHAMYMQDMLSDDESDALIIMLIKERDKIKPEWKQVTKGLMEVVDALIEIHQGTEDHKKEAKELFTINL